jgi:hypothetical protein
MTDTTITRGEMRVLDTSGDLKIVWSSDKPDEVAQARKTFDEMKTKGYSAFQVKKSGEPGKVLAAFDPDIEAMILVPRIVGG